MQAAGYHQVKHDPQVSFDPDRNSFADAPQLADLASFNTGERWFHSTQQKWACQPYMFNRLADYARFKRRDISGNVRQFRHCKVCWRDFVSCSVSNTIYSK
jgi:hypothetical protein